MGGDMSDCTASHRFVSPWCISAPSVKRVVDAGAERMIAVQLSVQVLTSDTRPDAADVIEANVRRILGQFFPADSLYVEQVHPEHQAGWR